MGSLELSGGTKLIELVHGIVAYFGYDYGVSFRIIYLYPIIFLAPLAIYLYSRKFLLHNISVFLASIVYLFNTYTLILQAAGVLMLVANIFSVFTLLFQYKFIFEKRSPVNFIIMVFFAFLVSVYDFRIFYILVGLTSLYALYTFLVLKIDKKIFLYHILFVFLVFVLNSHWLLTIISLNQFNDNAIFSRSIFGSQYFDVLSAITLFHRFWTGGEPAAFINQDIVIYMWLIPIFAILGYYFSKNHNKYFFIILLIVGVFLTKQEGIPFKNVYKVLYSSLPGFNAFREASKFYFISVISYSILIGFFCDFIYRYRRIGISRKIIVYILIFVIFIINTKPLLDKSFGTLFAERNIPNDYVIFNNWYKSIDKGHRVLWVPVNSKWGLYSNTSPAITLAYLDTANQDLKWRDDYDNFQNHNSVISDLLAQKFSPNLIENSNIKYIVLPLEDNANDDNFFGNYHNDRKYYYSVLKSLSYVREIDIGAEEIKVFEAKSVINKIYGINNEVSYEYITPFLYRVYLDKNNKDNEIVFSEAYDASWGLYYDDKSRFTNCKYLNCLFEILRMKKIEADHQVYFPNINYFSVNSDISSENNTVLLFYKPQKIYMIGLIIAGMTSIILCVIFISYLFRSLFFHDSN